MREKQSPLKSEACRFTCTPATVTVAKRKVYPGLTVVVTSKVGTVIKDLPKAVSNYFQLLGSDEYVILVFGAT